MEEIKLSKYQKNKTAIYKWRNNNLNIYNQKLQEYNKKNYEANKDAMISKIKVYQNKKKNEKEEETGVPTRKVGRPRKVYI